MTRMLLTVEQTYSAIRTPFRKRREKTLLALGLHKVGQTVEVPDTPEVRGMIRAVDHLTRVIYVRIDVRFFVAQVRENYRDTITTRIERGGSLWDQFENAAEHCIANPKEDERRLTELVNEIVVGSVLARDPALVGREIMYEPALPNGQRIDFVVEREKDRLYVEVKTVHPKTENSDAAWEKFEKRREMHPKNVNFITTKEGMGGAIYGDAFSSRTRFREYTLEFEKRVEIAKSEKLGPGVLVFCGSGFPWHRSQLEDFADFYNNRSHRSDDPFGPMEAHHMKINNIAFKYNIDGFAFLKRKVADPREEEFIFPVRGPRFGA